MNDSPPFKLSNFSFLIVDDVRTTRLQLSAVLKSLGSKDVTYSTSGVDALHKMQDPAVTVDCAIVDFIMPDMNGLQLLQQIRTGVAGIPRDLPVAMLTGCNDESLIGLALELDVDAFVLKPLNQRKISSCLQDVLTAGKKEDDWLKPPSVYKDIDVDTPVVNLLKSDPSSIEAALDLKNPPSNEKRYRIQNLPVDSIISRDISTRSGKVLYASGTMVSERHITRLKSLADLGFWDGIVWVASRMSRTVVDDGSVDSFFQFANMMTEGFRSTNSFEKLGKLSFESRVNCMRCNDDFHPSVEIISRHNRRELIFVWCNDCHSRNNELLCGVVKYMVLRGGFPLSYDEISDSYNKKKEMLEDPYADLRKRYEYDPLTKADVVHWIQDGFFQFDKNDDKLECRVDRVLSHPERNAILNGVGLLGKKGSNKPSYLK